MLRVTYTLLEWAADARLMSVPPAIILAIIRRLLFFGSCASVISSQPVAVFLLASVTHTVAKCVTLSSAWSTFALHVTC